MKTDIMFRDVKYPDGGKEVLAVFPHEKEMYNTVTCYAHLGQHSACDYDYIISISRPASDYSDLKKELESIGYDINIVKRRNYTKFLNSRR